MVNVKYVGSRSEVNIRVLGSLERGWKKDEVRELSSEQARVLEENLEFEVVGASKAKKPVEIAPVVKEEEILVDDEEEKDEIIVEE